MIRLTWLPYAPVVLLGISTLITADQDCYNPGRFFVSIFAQYCVPHALHIFLHQGQCLGPIVGTLITPGAAECLEKCQENESCQWYTYFVPEETCILTSDCDILDETCPTEECLYGGKQCSMGMLLAFPNLSK